MRGQNTFVLAALIAIGILGANAVVTNIDTYGSRKEVNCGNSEFESWYWTGQQCQQCYLYDRENSLKSYQCNKCNNDGTCSGECPDGFSAYNFGPFLGEKDQTILRCAPCTSNQFDDANGKSCCHYNLKEDDNDENGGTGALYSHWTETLDAKEGKAAQKLVGHVIKQIPNCAEINEYLKCKQCLPGYYVNEQQYCSPCKIEKWTQDYSSTFVRDPKISSYPSAGFSTSGVGKCMECQGPNQCSKCEDGFYLASNDGRETYDRNIAKYASFCKPCNDGCHCTDGRDLCESCIEEGYYKDPRTNTCKPCNAEGRSYCTKCAWNENVETVVCLSCDQEQEEESEDVETSNMITLKKKLYYRGAGNVQQSVDHLICKKCHEIFESTNQQYVIVDVDKENQVPDEAQEVQFKERKFTVDDFNNILTIGNDSEQYKKTKRGCKKCSLQQVSKNRETFKGDESDEDLLVNFITCNTCNNGYELNKVNSFVVKGKAYSEDQGNVVDRFWILPETQVCIRCDYAITTFDNQYTTKFNESANEFSKVKDNRSQNVRRCKRVSSPSDSFDQYQMTQCGPNRLGTSEYSTKFDNRMTKTEDTVTKYFTDSTTQAFNTYLVNVEGAHKDAIKNVCVDNINKCKTIKTINLSSSAETQGEFRSTLSQPLCVDCFEHAGYLLTKSQKCTLCSADALKVKGCNSCSKYKFNETEQSKLEKDDDLYCTGCQNDKECNSQGVKGTVDGNSARVTNPDTNYNLKNYFYENNKCLECNPGCRECLGNDKNCVRAQNYWRRIPESTSTAENNYAKAKFELCTHDHCIQCDENKDICEVCEPYYSLFTFEHKEGDKIVKNTKCQKCDLDGYCLKCGLETDDDLNQRRVCTECNYSSTYLENGVCKKARKGCASWEKEGGSCLQCQPGFRLNDGWCLECIDVMAGYYYCPSKCTNGGFNYNKTVNCRNEKLLEKDHATDGTLDQGGDEPETPEEGEGGDKPEARRVLKFLEDFDA